MAKRPVLWEEGMFLKPHHFQAAEQFVRERVRQSEDWLHPHNWGLKSVSFNEDSIANYRVVLNSCQARFKDGTTISVPDEVTIDSVPLQEALAKPGSETTVFLAIPSWSESRANVEKAPTGDARYFRKGDETPNENSGVGIEEIEFRYIQARLLLADHPDNLPPGFEVLPLARISRWVESDSMPKADRRAGDALESSKSERLSAAPRIDGFYVPPVLGLDTWTALHQEVRSLHEHIGSWISQESNLLVGRKISFETHLQGDADRILRLSTLNAAYSSLQSVISTRGLHPIDMYQELCRLLGQLSIFSEQRRPIDVPGYNHEEIGPIYAKVIQEIRRLVGGAPKIAFEKRYFQLVGAFFSVALDADWILDTAQLYIGVETTELTDVECDNLMRSVQWKLGSREKVGEIFTAAARGLSMRPLKRVPSALPSGVIYFEIERDPNHWKEVVRTHTLGLRFQSDSIRFINERMIAMTVPGQRQVNLQFAAYVVKPG
jgi:type VI secretion system protein ImpJ